MTVDFCDYFWGEKNNGFDILYHNMKHGLIANKDLSDFLRERTNIEETCSKLLAKLAKQTSSSSNTGTFNPLWQLLRLSIEKLTTIHIQMVHKVCELVKDVTKYTDELQKKHKNVKEEQSGTLDAVQAIQSTTLALQKAKDIYVQKGGELDKLRKDNASAKDIEKAEIKLKKAQDDYKVLVDKYSNVKEEFEKKMNTACKIFQEVEQSHLKQMKDFLNVYTELIESNHEEIGKVHVEFKKQCLEMTVDKLLEQFVLTKYTGLEKPENIEFEEVCLNSTSSSLNQVPDSSSDSKSIQGTNSPVFTSTPQNSCAASVASEKPSTAKREGNCRVRDKKDATNYQSSRATSLLNIFISNSHGAFSKSNRTVSLSADHTAYSLPQNSIRGSKWFLRSRRDKRKEKKTKKKKDSSGETIGKEDKSDNEEKEEEPKTNAPEIDDEGYCIQPSGQWTVDKEETFDSSSDSDEERDKRLHVEIKPLSNGAGPISASVDELRATVENISLLPLGTHTLKNRRGSVNDDGTMKRSKSVSQQLNTVKISNDLIGLNLFQPSDPTPNPVQQSTSMNSPTLSLTNKSISPPNVFPVVSRYAADLGDLFFDVGDAQQSTPKQGPPSTTPPVCSISIPRPPSRRENNGPRNQLSPISIGRTDSVSSLDFRSSGVLGPSRGPSPLTIGLCDSIPLAVAFHEIIHAYFKGSNESRCQVKMFGDMMVSFPAGIANILANNPNPAKLTFRLKNTTRVENILPNKQLVLTDNLFTTTDSTVYEFNMPALTSLLRKQFEQNPVASYFNVDILKYQVKLRNTAAASCPFQLVSFYKCSNTYTDLKIGYKFNSHSMSVPSPLLNVTVSANLNSAIRNMQSKPTAQWASDTKTVSWRFAELAQYSESQGSGSLKARFEVDSLCPISTIVTQFNCEGTTLSGLEFELASSGYRVSLIKRRFVAGKYICDGEPDPKSSTQHSTVSSDC
ncbi:F-BAR domain only protein 2 isoform X1 [Acyrthosiphon pisum]|uniref:F-BAR domain only protein 2 n=1 Tax=Acyrthosiphon pisum TaxID=7029 RepID=A0A8R2FC72_ACYPI|nr:F-BAR domain only protein 2 isoform X1 [Acyrthosiphon pisum]|eukprot:XP_008188561.2 PREDICTED: F-BAR domain only protein 2 isoform X1 [Acyrthosiphon pisum]